MREVTRSLVDHLWYCLPADEFSDIEARMAARIGHRVRNVRYLISCVNDHAAEFGWCVPHAKRGYGSIKHRYLRVKVDGSGRKIFDNATDLQSFEDGMQGDFSYTSTLMGHEAVAIRAASLLITSRRESEFLLGYAEDCEAISKKAIRVVNILRERDAA